MNERKIKWREVVHHWELYLFIVPTVLLIGLFQYYPAASGVYHSFFHWNGGDISEYVGWNNFTDLVKNKAFWDSFRVALILGAWNVAKMIPALVVAVCIHRCRSERMQFIYRTLFVVPMVIPGLVVALIWRSFFFESTQGYLNRFLHFTHLLDVLQWLDKTLHWGGIFAADTPPSWLGDPRLILTACVVWGFPWVGSFAVLTHLAKLQGINKEIYEACELDGASWYSKFTRIELPLILDSIYILLVFVIIDTIKDAGMILALAGLEGGPGGKVTVPALFMLRKAFVEQSMGYACAVGIVLTAVVITLQKLSQGLLAWNNLLPGQRAVYRLAVVLLAALMIVSGHFVPLAILLLVAILPRSWWRLPSFLVTAWTAARRPHEPGDLPAPRWRESGGLRRQRMESLALRATKHLTICLVLAFAFLPLYLMLIVSFKDNQQFYAKPATLTAPLHWENWVSAWQSITPTLANSIFVASFSTLFTLLFALGAAYFFARARLPMAGLLWNAVLILMIMPTIANLIPLFRLLGDLNLLNTLSALIIVGAAGGQVFAIFVLRSFVADVPKDLFEAAEIDGASHWQQMMNIVVPLSGPILSTVAVMTFLTNWNDFVLPLIVMRDHSRLPVMVALLRLSGEYIKLWGPLMAGYTLASLPIIFLFVCSMKLFVRGLTEGASKG